MAEESYFKKELEKESLREPALISKLFWLKPKTAYNQMEYRGIDQRDKYKSTKKDEWDAQVWNIPTTERNHKCMDYFIDFRQCKHFIASVYPAGKFAYDKHSNYCWKQELNHKNCINEYMHHHPEFYIKGSKIDHH